MPRCHRRIAMLFTTADVILERHDGDEDVLSAKTCHGPVTLALAVRRIAIIVRIWGKKAMQDIDVTTTVTLTDDEVAGLAEVLGCPEVDVPDRLGAFASAAIHEYASMMLGTGPLTSVSDLRERRLVLMILHAYAGRVPDVDEITRVFNVSAATATTMLRNVMSKHRRRILAAVQADVDAFKAGCVQQANDDWHVTVQNPVLVEMLNARLTKAGQSKARIVKDPKTLGQYIVPNGSYEWIDQNL